MKPLQTLLDRGKGDLLGPELHRLYGGGLGFPDASADRPYAVTNSVTTIEGLTSFGITGRSGGGEISAGNLQDRFVMGLLRALADAVIVGAGTLRSEPGHIWSPDFICPEYAGLYAGLRQKLGKRAPSPAVIIVTGSGNVASPDQAIPDVFIQPQMETVILTTEEGGNRAAHVIADRAAPHILTFGTRESVDFVAALRHLRRAMEIRMLLGEGGAMLNGAMIELGLYDEVFMTMAPVLIGTPEEHRRPLFAQGFVRAPETAIQHEMMSVKLADDYLFKRYARRVAPE